MKRIKLSWQKICYEHSGNPKKNEFFFLEKICDFRDKLLSLLPVLSKSWKNPTSIPLIPVNTP
jgi:hypothetical protein